MLLFCIMYIIITSIVYILLNLSVLIYNIRNDKSLLIGWMVSGVFTFIFTYVAFHLEV